MLIELLKEMPEELKKLYREYHAIFGTLPCYHAELDGVCPEAFDAELIAEAIEKKKSLPYIVIGEELLNDENIFWGG